MCTAASLHLLFRSLRCCIPICLLPSQRMLSCEPSSSALHQHCLALCFTLSRACRLLAATAASAGCAGVAGALRMDCARTAIARGLLSFVCKTGLVGCAVGWHLGCVRGCVRANPFQLMYNQIVIPWVCSVCGESLCNASRPCRTCQRSLRCEPSDTKPCSHCCFACNGAAQLISSAPAPPHMVLAVVWQV